MQVDWHAVTVRSDTGVKVKGGMMLINELAHRTGASARALRHYDRVGLLGSRRLGNGYRDFDESAVEQVRRIRFLLDVGLTLSVVAQLLPCFAPSGTLTACPVARERLRARLREADDAIARIQRTRGLLNGTLRDLAETP
jgi:DNA-binding transcriptional MerR regulator